VVQLTWHTSQQLRVSDGITIVVLYLSHLTGLGVRVHGNSTTTVLLLHMYSTTAVVTLAYLWGAKASS
jgi:hypothetical protein